MNASGDEVFRVSKVIRGLPTFSRGDMPSEAWKCLAVNGTMLLNIFKNKYTKSVSKLMIQFWNLTWPLYVNHLRIIIILNLEITIWSLYE